uniref:Uncharacterized protein n=1 Tax=Glossina austeni TaxID=7395 RepID=A0A1A9V6L3_GLOAU
MGRQSSSTLAVIIMLVAILGTTTAMNVNKDASVNGICLRDNTTIADASDISHQYNWENKESDKPFIIECEAEGKPDPTFYFLIQKVVFSTHHESVDNRPPSHNHHHHHHHHRHHHHHHRRRRHINYFNIFTHIQYFAHVALGCALIDFALHNHDTNKSRLHANEYDSLRLEYFGYNLLFTPTHPLILPPPFLICGLVKTCIKSVEKFRINIILFATRIDFSP